MIKRFLILELTRLLALGVVTVMLTAAQTFESAVQNTVPAAQSATPGAQTSAPTETRNNMAAIGPQSPRGSQPVDARQASVLSNSVLPRARTPAILVLFPLSVSERGQGGEVNQWYFRNTNATL
jgi:hypothetical protein